MKFLTQLGNVTVNRDGSINVAQSEGVAVEDKIMACNPILESFGNAKTVRNDNSSRFGKYVALLVDKESKKIVGATITNYLLEKSRVCTPSINERNYHIFYSMCVGMTDELRKKYYLTNAGGKCDLSKYESMNKTGCYEVPGKIDD